MPRMHLLSVLACLLLVLGLFGPASARPWKPTAHERAQDYLQIEHSLSDSEIVIVIWMAPQFFDPKTMDPTMAQVFNEYAIVSILHFSMNDLGQFSSIEPADVTLELSESGSLTPLAGSEIPPVVSSILHLLETSLGGGFGPVGQGIKSFVYDGTQVDSCGGGKLWDRYLEERYEYEMPVPGCPNEQRAEDMKRAG